jgi:peptide-methionine (R)-S-oxide reductase
LIPEPVFPVRHQAIDIFYIYLSIGPIENGRERREMTDKITRTDAQWRAQLSDLAYKVTRRGGTERAFSNDDFPKTDGTFHCICCDAALFDTTAKFDSGTGWPSFFQPLSPETVRKRADNGWLMRRTEVVCNTCEAHLGHVFSDGPHPTGLRYCMNGVALKFEPGTGD